MLECCKELPSCLSHYTPTFSLVFGEAENLISSKSITTEPESID